MPDASVERREHYVYVLYHEDGQTPFYVGLGSGDRWAHHERMTRQGKQSPKDSVIRAMLDRGIAVPKRKVAEGLTRMEAIRMEIDLISSIGRSPNGPLTNRTAGGEGARGLDPETRAKRSESQKRNFIAHPERRARISEIHRNRQHSPRSAETKAKLSAVLKGSDAWKKVDPDRRRQIVHEMQMAAQEKRRLAREADPNWRANQIEKRKAYHRNRWPLIKADREAKTKTPEFIAARKAYDRARYLQRLEEKARAQNTDPPHENDSPIPE